jgi:hypothetical protein
MEESNRDLLYDATPIICLEGHQQNPQLVQPLSELRSDPGTCEARSISLRSLFLHRLRHTAAYLHSNLAHQMKKIRELERDGLVAFSNILKNIIILWVPFRGR